MPKILIAVVIAFAAGFGVSYFTQKPTTPAGESCVQCEQLSEAKANLVEISKNEYLEYTQIKDQKQKYEKADELLGRIMLLFLADLGFKVQNKDTLAEAAANSPDTVTPPPYPANQASPLPTGGSNNNTPYGGNGTPPPPASLATGLKGKSSIIAKLTSEESIRAVLDSSVIENPKLEVAQATQIESRHMRRLVGSYRGFINLLKPDTQPLSVTWNLSLSSEQNSKEPVGHYTLSIHGEGRNSETNGSGSFVHFSVLNADDGAILIKACGEGCVLQLYYNEAADQLVGNFYDIGKENSKNKLERTGTIVLTR